MSRGRTGQIVRVESTTRRECFKIVVGDVTILAGDKVDVRGESGEFVFRGATQDVTTGSLLWVTVVGGKQGRRLMRHFAPERIGTVVAVEEEAS